MLSNMLKNLKGKAPELKKPKAAPMEEPLEDDMDLAMEDEGEELDLGAADEGEEALEDEEMGSELDAYDDDELLAEVKKRGLKA